MVTQALLGESVGASDERAVISASPQSTASAAVSESVERGWCLFTKRKKKLHIF